MRIKQVEQNPFLQEKKTANKNILNTVEYLFSLDQLTKQGEQIRQDHDLIILKKTAIG